MASVVPWNLHSKVSHKAMTAEDKQYINIKVVLALPYNRLLPSPPIATENICLCWLFKIINPHNQMSSKLLYAIVASPEMLDFSQGKGNIGIRNVISKRIFTPEVDKTKN